MQERTLAIIKPDAVNKCLIGNIIQRIEIAGFDIIDMKMIKMSKEKAKGFYKVHAKKPFYNDLAKFMASGPCVVIVLEGMDVIERYRKLIGATNYKEAAAGTIREAFATSIRHNVVHGSDSKKSADFEINYFFDGLV